MFLSEILKSQLTFIFACLQFIEVMVTFAFVRLCSPHNSPKCLLTFSQQQQDFDIELLTSINKRHL